MRVYAIACYPEPVFYVATQEEAFRRAREWSGKPDAEDATVELIELVKMDRAGILRLLNSEGGYVERSKPLATFRKGRIVADFRGGVEAGGA